MLILEGTEPTARIDLRLAAILSCVAGVLNAVGFERAGLFSSNMTGNVSGLSDSLALGDLPLAASFLLLLVSFVLGAFLAGFGISVGRRRRWCWIYALKILLEALLLIGLAFCEGIFSSNRGLICVLSLALGWQNAVSTGISSARVRTTHVSGMATALGLALGSLGAGDDGAPRHRDSVALYTTIILAFLAGGVFGTLVYLSAGVLVFLVCGLPLAVLASAELLRATRSRSTP